MSNKAEVDHDQGVHGSNALFRGAAWSFVGQILPLLVAMATIPRLLHSLGDARFGLLMLFWMLVGYFSILDLGLGRALILVFSRLRPGLDKEEISSVFWTGSAILLSLGIAIGASVQLLAPWISDLLGVAAEMRAEAVGAIRIAGWTMPPMLVMHVLMGLPTAFQRLRGLNLLRIPAGILSHLVPLAMVFWTTDLRHIMAANLVLRIVLLLAHYRYAVHVQPVSLPPAPSRATAVALLSVGSWMMFTNLLAPLLMNIDRVIISNQLGAAALASYAPAMDMAVKVLVLLGGPLTVLLPALGHHVRNAPERAVAVYNSSLRSLGWWMTPCVILGLGASRPFMAAWLGQAHGVSAGVFLSIFLVGIHWCFAATVSFAAVQALGDARKASFVHLFELPLLLLGLWFFLSRGDILGAAWVWSARHLIDAAALHLLARTHGLGSGHDREIALPLAIGTAFMLPIPFLHQRSEFLGIAYAFLVSAGWLFAAWRSSAGQKAIPEFARTRLPFLVR